MTQAQRRTLHYAPPESRIRRIPWIALVTMSVLVTACMLTAVYERIEEPFRGPAKARDILALRMAPIGLIVLWCAWALLVCLKTRPRIAAAAVLLIGIPAGVWSGRLTWDAHRSFESDQAAVAEWNRMAEEEAAMRSKD